MGAYAVPRTFQREREEGEGETGTEGKLIHGLYIVLSKFSYYSSVRLIAIALLAILLY